MPQELTLQDILGAIEDLSSNNDRRFEAIDRRFESIERRIATKDDFAGFATKDDFAGFATKDDLAGFATKDDLSNFPTKDDLAGFATKDDLQEFKQEILDHIDWFAAQHNRYDTELLALRSASMRHEDRITTLEERSG